MRVLLRALSLAAALGFANAAAACPTDMTHDMSKAEVTAPSADVVLLNHEDDHPAASRSPAASWSASPDWDEIAFSPTLADVDDLDLSFRILVDDEGAPLMLAIASTGSLGRAAEEAPVAPSLALDGYEDR